MKALFKRTVTVLLAAALPLSVSVGLSAGAEETGDLAPGKYVDHGKYQKSQDIIVTQHLLFAMPSKWQNDTTKDPRCNGAAGMYWWTGWDKCENRGWSNAWPGYECDKVEEEGVPNLHAIDVPTFGNGGNANATMIIWNNYIDGGMERDPVKNPFYQAAQQTRDFQSGYYNRNDDNAIYEPMLRYIYRYNLEKNGVEGASSLDIHSEDFWKQINQIAAKHLNRNYNAMDSVEQEIVVDELIDTLELDFSVFGETYASNFFNMGVVEKWFPLEEANDGGISFHCDNMVFVVSFDPDRMGESPISHKIGYDGDFFFYYGNGRFGSWPTEELNTEMKGVSGDFTKPPYWDPDHPALPLPAPSITAPASAAPETAEAPETTSDKSRPLPSPDPTSFMDPDKGGGSDGSNDANGAIATGQQSGLAILIIALAAGIGAAIFFRKNNK